MKTEHDLMLTDLLEIDCDMAELRAERDRLKAANAEMLEICKEIADDSRCDLVNSERRIRLYAAIKKADRL